ncbi:MAG: hypothetical protein C0481_10830 [Phenylobacterium sp.]|nr:hypothetical protein [Phenylobacterium sp.]
MNRAKDCVAPTLVTVRLQLELWRRHFVSVRQRSLELDDLPVRTDINNVRHHIRKALDAVRTAVRNLREHQVALDDKVGALRDAGLVGGQDACLSARVGELSIDAFPSRRGSTIPLPNGEFGPAVEQSLEARQVVCRDRLQELRHYLQCRRRGGHGRDGLRWECDGRHCGDHPSLHAHLLPHLGPPQARPSGSTHGTDARATNDALSATVPCHGWLVSPAPGTVLGMDREGANSRRI